MKFKEGTSPAERASVIHALEAKGSPGAHPLFPDATDGKLASLYVVEANGQDAQRLIRFLNGLAPVEFAEPEVRRSLAG